MKTVATLVLTAFLAACSGGVETVTPTVEVITASTTTQEPEITSEPRYCTAEILTNCVAKVPAACSPDDPSCKVLFCQPVGYCPIDEPKPARPAMPILNVICAENPENGCPPNRH